MKLFLRSLKYNKGLALIIVVSSLALISILVIAIFSLTRREFKATQGYVSGKNARQLGDAAVAVVQAQIQNGHALTTTGTFHATQPGMVRVYDADGGFSKAHKLYSSAVMTVTGAEESLYTATHMAPSDWVSQPERFVDLNEPVIRPAPVTAAGSASTGYTVYFPIIDPRAAHNFGGGGSAAGEDGTPGTTQVEGFSYDKTTALLGRGEQSYSTVLTPGGGTPENLRLPMPVEWLYVLQDGTIGALNASKTFVAPGTGSEPSVTNPIVGRIAFWTDDESCKININTAAEPTFSSTPYYFHLRDSKWAHFPAATGEYQRFPGHPATVALSAVFAPNYLLDPYYPDRDGGGLSRTQIVNLKNNIYERLPKIAPGGSEAGTRPFVTDDFSDRTLRDSEAEGKAAEFIDLEAAWSERLYASVDELLFTDGGFASKGRTPSRFKLPGTAVEMFGHDAIERSRFFLTAHSRSPEFTLHGLPRVCMWPVADESLGQNYRTSFDNLIALTAKIGTQTAPGGSYFFRRAQSYSSTYDLGGNQYLSRNEALLDYLVEQMSSITWPATSPSSSRSASSFQDKYGSQNVSQLAIQFFDYIRCTNLYDGMLARKNEGWDQRGNNSNNRYMTRDDLRGNGGIFTYTAPRITEQPRTVNNPTAELQERTAANDPRIKTSRAGDTGTYPGHGQVSPAIWNKNGNKHKGFGRMFTLSEIGFHFICTADGMPVDEGVGPDGEPLLHSLKTFRDSPLPAQEKGRGGGTAPRWAAQQDNSLPPNGPTYQGYNVDEGPARWYSNFPPIKIGSEHEMFPIYGCKADEPATSNPYHPSKHPGFKAENWNWTLKENTPLETNQKRLQAMFVLEAFCPSAGWTSFYPEFTIVMDLGRLANIKVTNTTEGAVPLFNGSGLVAIKSNGNIFSSGNNRAIPLGGHASPTMIAGGRRLLGMIDGGLRMPVDQGYDPNNSSGHQALNNFQFVSLPFTMDRDGTVQLEFPNEDIEIKIYDTHNYESADPVQVIHVNFGSMGLDTTLPMPHLVGPVFTLPGTNKQVASGPAGRGSYQAPPNSSTGRAVHRRALPGPHWWGFNWGGALDRTTGGQVNPNYTLDPLANPPPVFWSREPTMEVAGDADAATPDRRMTRGRLDTDGNGGWQLPPYDTWAGVSLIPDSYSDVIRTIVPTVGDYRVLAAMSDVPAQYWKPHPLWQPGWNQIRQAHSFSGHTSNSDAGAFFGIEPSADYSGIAPGETKNFRTDLQLVGGAGYQNDRRGNLNVTTITGRHPDFPPDQQWAQAANAFGDFDAMVGNGREGAYINKPDEGNFYASWEQRGGSVQFERSGYFREAWEHAEDWRSGIFMTPNRLISSPVFFGSLPTGVFGSNGLPSAADTSGVDTSQFAPWQTLLFRPHAQITSVQPASANSHPGAENPSDHYLLDLFYMPVVEPYAISEPLSIAGRINMNYQIMPFTHIRRATGMHALMKGEFVTAIPNNQIARAKEYRVRNGGTEWDDTFSNDQDDNAYWHRPIDVRATLRQFDLRFKHSAGGAQNANGLFRSATQICDLHLIPVDVGAGVSDVGALALRNASSQADFDSAMNSFWGENRPTGDNIRERAYSNLYARLTTRTDTFRVHVRTQTIKKARSTQPDKFDSSKDSIVSEYRGSYLLERYIDPNDADAMPDYAASGGAYGGGKPPLDAFYRFRTLETKRFAP